MLKTQDQMWVAEKTSRPATCLLVIDHSPTGDGQRPVCQKCITSRRQCDRSARALKFIVHGASGSRDLDSTSPGAFPAANSGNPVQYLDGYPRPLCSLPSADATGLSVPQSPPSRTDYTLQSEFIAFKIGNCGS
jgi:hypothetical protein